MRKFLPLLKDDYGRMGIAFGAMIVNSGLTLVAPLLIGIAINRYIETKQLHGLLFYTGLVFAVYIGAFITQYIQTKTMGGVGQRLLYSLRNTVFNKLQSLPIAFFNQNKAGDLISRLNSDTDNLNQFFSQSLMQFLGSIFMIVGAGIFILSINLKLGLMTLIPLAVALFFTQVLSPWIKKENAKSLQEVGGMSAEIQESLGNFKVIVAFNRRDYFRQKFEVANHKNFITSVWAGVANYIFLALYTLAASAAQLIVLVYGIHLIMIGSFTLGFLISYISYASRLYDPLRQMAALWSTFQTAIASWDRITAILSMENDIRVVTNSSTSSDQAPVLSFKDVGFTYTDGKTVLNDVTLTLEQGKTYALVGPTGGGKTTTASLMARLYDPSRGTIEIEGADIRTLDEALRSKKIGFILQEPFLFTGTVGDNIFYGNAEYDTASDDDRTVALKQAGLSAFIEQFEEGLATPVTQSGESISLGQRQLVAFMRAVLRKPDIIILDEATANIDTVTERLLEEVIEKLPSNTTKVIIAHRLNTIQTADEIYFVNNGAVTSAGSFDNAVELLLHAKRTS
ncbi:MAG TPA: ABC transporter ATP-binding protein [Candidatus Paceibacterota bacterium]|nr:ABC transporter ATP-binding protein [Candidatus Paceibacterota bacterium]